MGLPQPKKYDDMDTALAPLDLGDGDVAEAVDGVAAMSVAGAEAEVAPAPLGDAVDPATGAPTFAVWDVTCFDLPPHPHLSREQLRELSGFTEVAAGRPLPDPPQDSFAWQARGWNPAEPLGASQRVALCERNVLVRVLREECDMHLRSGSAQRHEALTKLEAAREAWHLYCTQYFRQGQPHAIKHKPDFSAIDYDYSTAQALGRLCSELAFCQVAAHRHYPLQTWRAHKTHLGTAPVMLAHGPLVLPILQFRVNKKSGLFAQDKWHTFTVGGRLQAALKTTDGHLWLISEYDPLRQTAGGEWRGVQYVWQRACDCVGGKAPEHGCDVLILPRDDVSLLGLMRNGGAEYLYGQLNQAKLTLAHAEQVRQALAGAQELARVAREQALPECMQHFRVPLAELLQTNLWFRSVDEMHAECPGNARTYKLRAAVNVSNPPTHATPPCAPLAKDGAAAVHCCSPRDWLLAHGDDRCQWVLYTQPRFRGLAMTPEAAEAAQALQTQVERVHQRHLELAMEELA